jgi:hypothetical protein
VAPRRRHRRPAAAASDGASLQLTARLPAACAAALYAALADATSGRVRLQEAPPEEAADEG